MSSDGELRVFDTNAGKLVGRVIEEDTDGIFLTHPGIVELYPTPLEGGEKFKITARIQCIVLAKDIYCMYREAIRGECSRPDPWLVDLYAQFEQKSAAGDFDLNPYGGVATALQPVPVSAVAADAGEIDAEVDGGTE